MKGYERKCIHLNSIEYFRESITIFNNQINSLLTKFPIFVSYFSSISINLTKFSFFSIPHSLQKFAKNEYDLIVAIK